MKKSLLITVMCLLSMSVLGISPNTPINDTVKVVNSVHNSAKACRAGEPDPAYSLNVVYCNLGGYTVKKVTLYLYDKDGNEISKMRTNVDKTIFGGVTFSHQIQLTEGTTPNYFRAKLRYWIAGGDKKSCDIEFNPRNGKRVWKVYSHGTTQLKNRCRSSLEDAVQ